MNLHYQDDHVTLYHGDCLDVLATLPDVSVDAVVTDPPYGLDFMGRDWDRYTSGDFQHWCERWAAECLRVLKPGGHMVAFGGTRTFHRLTTGVEDAGFEIRDSLAWLYGSGFPKSLDVSKAIDRMAGAEREVVGMVPPSVGGGRSAPSHEGWQRPWMQDEAARDKTRQITAPATPEAAQWDGWGTALKPAFEPIVLARKPFPGTVARNVLEHGTGAINVEACRVPAPHGRPLIVKTGETSPGSSFDTAHSRQDPAGTTRGRWPANVLLDQHAAAWVDEQSGVLKSGHMNAGTTRATRQGAALGTMPPTTGAATHGDSGGASRFFYVAKAPKRERPNVDGVQHPTVKPLALMEWLIRLVTPEGGTVLDPFAGSGTTLEAAQYTGHSVIGIEKGDEYIPLIVHRIERPDPRVKTLKRG